MEKLDHVLVEILGQMDAIFFVQRDFVGHSGSNFYTSRKTFLEMGIPLRGGGQDRSAFSRQVDAAKEAGLVNVVRRSKSIWPFVRMVDKAEERARSMCRLPNLNSSWVMLDRIDELAREGKRCWIPEWLLADFEGPRGIAAGSKDERELLIVQHMSLPGLARGWLQSNATVNGHACYAVGPHGKEALDAGEPAEFGKDLFDQDALDIYLQSYRTARAALMTGPPENPKEIGRIPLSTSALNWPKIKVT